MYFTGQLSVAVHSPMLARNDRRRVPHERGVVRITPKQYRLIVALMRRRSWTQRDLAAAAGYADPGGVSRAIGDLARLGLVAVTIRRGRRGFTLGWLRRGVHVVRNVVQHVLDDRRHTEQRPSRTSSTAVSFSEVLGNILGMRPPAPVGGPAR